MKSILLFLLFLLSTNVFAQSDNPASGKTLALSIGSPGDENIAFGLEVDTPVEPVYSWGFYGRIVTEGDTDKGGIAFGVNAKPHYKLDKADLSVAPGIGVIYLEPNDGGGKVPVLGPSLIWGLSYPVEEYTVGFNITELYSWVGPVRGLLMREFMLSFINPIE